MTSSTTTEPKRGEIWSVSLDPTVGAEIKKTRPTVVVNADGLGKLPLRMIVPITEWDEAYEALFWMIPVDPDGTNNLAKKSAADAFQIRSVSTERFTQKHGMIGEKVLRQIAAAVVIFLKFR